MTRKNSRHHYPVPDAVLQLSLPVGKYSIEAVKGFEYVPADLLNLHTVSLA